MQEFLETILKQCLDILDSQSGSILLTDKNNKDIVVKVARGWKCGDRIGQRMKMGQGISGMVAQSRKPLLVEDLRNDHSVKTFCRVDNYKTHSFLSVPITARGRLVGVLNITEKNDNKSFTSKELSYVSAIASCAALAIDRILFSEHLEKQLDCFKNSTAVSRFTSAIAHELNNPLDGTLRYNKLALLHAQDNEVVREYLIEMRHGLKRMENVIRSMLQLSFAGNRSMNPLTRNEVNIREVIEKALDFYKHESVYKEIEITTEIDPELPLIRDCGLLNVFLNLIKNSIDAIDRQGKINIKVFSGDDNIVIDFSDNGSGIDDGLEEKILEPFFTTKPQGRGLGLAIVKEFVDCYKGKIRAENLSQGGARFIVSIPIGGI